MTTTMVAVAPGNMELVQQIHDKYFSRMQNDVTCQSLSRYAQVLLMSNRADEAGAFFEASMAQCPHHLDDAFVLRDHDECVNTLAHYAFFVEHHRHNWVQAKRIYERILANHPTHPHALGNYAMLVHKMNSATKAHETNNAVVHHAYNVAIREFPAHGSVLCKYAGLLVQENNVALAETYYTQAASTSPTSPDILGNYAMFLHAIKQDHPAAEEMYIAAIQLDPLHANNLGNYAFFLGSVCHNPQDAEVFYKRSLTCNRHHATNWFNYGMLLWRELKHTDNAEQCFQHALALQPHHAPAALNYARMLDAECGHAALADAYFAQAIDADDQNSDAYLDYASFLFREHRPLEAERMYQTAHALAPSNTNATYNLAKVLLLHMESPSYDINRSATDTSQVEVLFQDLIRLCPCKTTLVADIATHLAKHQCCAPSDVFDKAFAVAALTVKVSVAKGLFHQVMEHHAAKAEACYKRAIFLDKTDVDAVTVYAKVSRLRIVVFVL
ncbi:hypothetical protein, variant [Aphanomyces astaci]|uniref:Uncharacterized protein n=1 Tax=Aphanomyces astaci TaxID=112090 RepID=W4GLC5_APHAT|nr:hypothetical protein, variant [Aphanomyces astaci]ETV80146.1 hypothetical protein, variant [Aphanomyces astaci]|eukprot:XP_009830070.1 hypothetical protein, variant [Aphanomyces astaci]